MQKGGWDNVNNPSTLNGSNVDTGDSASTIDAEYYQTAGTFLNEINNESSAGGNITKNRQGGGGQ